MAERMSSLASHEEVPFQARIHEAYRSTYSDRMGPSSSISSFDRLRLLSPTRPMSRRPSPRQRAAAGAKTSPIATSGTSPTSSPTGKSGKRATSSLEAGIDKYAALQGHACRGSRPAARCVPAVRNPRTTGLSRLVFPVAALRRGSARQHRQREAAAGPDSVRAVEAGRVLVQPGAAEDSAGDRARVDGRVRAAAAVPLRDRGSVSAAGARARRGRRAVDVALEPPGVSAERRLLGALHGRREVPDRAAVDRGGRDGVVRAVPRDPGHAARAGGPRGGVPGAARDLSEQPQHLRHALQRRLPARLVSGARARLREHARRARCTATTSRRRSSRT